MLNNDSPATNTKPASASQARPRSVERLVQGSPTSDGAGVKLTRLLTQDLQRRLDPFLMLDNFASDNPDDYIGGFPDHPHRGFETMTYMIEGKMRHRDSAGNAGLLETGGVQWMTAGRGLIHSELPEQEDGRMEGFQLWLNLPSADKMCSPWYRDIQAPNLPQFDNGTGAVATVIAGVSHGVAGSVQRPVTEPLIVDIQLHAGGQFVQPILPDYNVFVVVYRGQAQVGDHVVDAGSLAILANSPDTDSISLRATDSPVRLLLVAGKPLNEPIAQYGPFVMTTQAELIQAVEDYRAGRFHTAG